MHRKFRQIYAQKVFCGTEKIHRKVLGSLYSNNGIWNLEVLKTQTYQEYLWYSCSCLWAEESKGTVCTTYSFPKSTISGWQMVTPARNLQTGASPKFSVCIEQLECPFLNSTFAKKNPKQQPNKTCQGAPLTLHMP